MIVINNLVIILGNGFTIDFLSHIDKDNEIDVRNLFSQGNCVPWPADEVPGFLSYKNCPNLWNLGARPSMGQDEASNLIENIITCANISAASNKNHTNIYISAYKELAMYLKYLFVYYNSKISDEDIKLKLDSWGWFKYLKYLNTTEKFKKITIITYNYDIWLERILMIADIDFDIIKAGHQTESKFSIIKPHGSISFAYKEPMQKSSFFIKHDRSLKELLEGKTEDFRIAYEDLDENYYINPIIPPAGDSDRINCQWAKELREATVKIAESLYGDSEVLICGLSYWHVDRIEIDDILTSLDSDITIKLLNPSPPGTLNAVLSSLFKNYLHYTSSSILGVIANEKVLL